MQPVIGITNEARVLRDIAVTGHGHANIAIRCYNVAIIIEFVRPFRAIPPRQYSY